MIIRETTDLVTTFRDASGKTFDWKYKDVDTSLSPQEMKEACQLMTSLDLFEKDGVKLFDTLVEGHLITTRDTVVYSRSMDVTGETESEEEIVEETTPEEEIVEEIEETEEKTECEKPATCVSLPLVERERTVARTQLPAPETNTAIRSYSLINQTPEKVTESTPIRRNDSGTEASDAPSPHCSAEEEQKKPRQGLLHRLFHRTSRTNPDASEVRIHDHDG